MGLVGIATPRLFTQPLNDVQNSNWTDGCEVAAFAADEIGEPLMPWQEEAARRGLEKLESGGYRYRIVLVLVARQSGKTHLLRTISLWKMTKKKILVVGAAQDSATARECWMAAAETVEYNDRLKKLKKSIKYGAIDTSLTLTNGSRYTIRAATRGAGRGLSVEQLNLDELREWRDWDAWAALSKTTNAKEDGQIWIFSNAGDDQSVVLNRLREIALSGEDDSICILEWSAPDGCELDDEEAWCQANPGLGTTVSEQAIRTALTTDPPAIFRTEVLCQRVQNTEEAVDMRAWEESSDPRATMDTVKDRVCIGVDVSLDAQHVTCVAAASDRNGVTRVEVVAAWSSTLEARQELPKLIQRIKPKATAWFPGGPAAAIAGVLRSARNSREISQGKVSEACMTFADLVAARRIRHNGDPLLLSHLAQASRMPVSDGWRFARRGAVGHVDAAYAASAAVMAASEMPAIKRGRTFVVGA